MEVYNKVFKMSNGKEIKVADSYMGRFIGVHIKREYLEDEYRSKSQDFSEGYEGVKTHERFLRVIMKPSESSSKTTEVKDVYAIAEDKNWVEYPTASYYAPDKACNCDYYTKVEVVLQDEEFSRRIFIDWKGDTGLDSLLSGIDYNLWDELIDNAEKHNAKLTDEDSMLLELYSDNGEHIELEYESSEELAKRITSVRIIEFKETIKES